MTKAEDTREKILERAVVLARHVGLEGVTLGTLATETGLSKSGLYAHFQSKENLQLEIIKLSAEQFADEVFRPAIQEPRGLPACRPSSGDGWSGCASRAGASSSPPPRSWTTAPARCATSWCGSRSSCSSRWSARRRSPSPRATSAAASTPPNSPSS